MIAISHQGNIVTFILTIVGILIIGFSIFQAAQEREDAKENGHQSMIKLGSLTMKPTIPVDLHLFQITASKKCIAVAFGTRNHRYFSAQEADCGLLDAPED